MQVITVARTLAMYALGLTSEIRKGCCLMPVPVCHAVFIGTCNVLRDSESELNTREEL